MATCTYRCLITQSRVILGWFDPYARCEVIQYNVELMESRISQLEGDKT